MDTDNTVLNPRSHTQQDRQGAALHPLPDQADSDERTLCFTHGVVDLVRAEVAFHDGQWCALSRLEVNLLSYLARDPGVPVSRDELLAEVWKIDPTYVLTRTVDMHVSNLRRKLRDDAKNPTVLRTINRLGYMLAVESVRSVHCSPGGTRMVNHPRSQDSGH